MLVELTLSVNRGVPFLERIGLFSSRLVGPRAAPPSRCCCRGVGGPRGTACIVDALEGSSVAIENRRGSERSSVGAVDLPRPTSGGGGMRWHVLVPCFYSHSSCANDWRSLSARALPSGTRSVLDTAVHCQPSRARSGRRTGLSHVWSGRLLEKFGPPRASAMEGKSGGGRRERIDGSPKTQGGDCTRHVPRTVHGHRSAGPLGNASLQKPVTPPESLLKNKWTNSEEAKCGEWVTQGRRDTPTTNTAQRRKR